MSSRACREHEQFWVEARSAFPTERSSRGGVSFGDFEARMFPGIKFMCEWEFDKRFREVPDVPGVWAYIGIDQTLIGQLILWGTEDQINPIGTAAKWGDHTRVESAGHLLEWDQPEAVAQALLAFLPA